MQNGKRPPKGQARQDLIDATLDVVTESGLEHCTVRRVAEKAGVTNGLIRFYFQNKAELLRAAYQYHLDQIVKVGDDRIYAMQAPPKEVLRTYVVANLSPPIVTAETVLLWSSFVPLTFRDTTMADVRDEHYRQTMDRFERLIGLAFAGDGIDQTQTQVHHHADRICALIDGLWLAGAMYPWKFSQGELVDIGLTGAQNMLGLDLSAGAGAPRRQPD